MTIASLYALLDPTTSNIRYIGYTTKNIEKRVAQHICACKSSREKNCHRCNWLNNLRIQDLYPNYKILLQGNLEEIKEEEINYINYFKTLTKLTNNTLGGDGTPGLKWSETSKRNFSKSQSGILKPYSRVQILGKNRITKEEKLFADKFEASEYIKCRPNSILDVACGRRNSVNNWKLISIKRKVGEKL